MDESLKDIFDAFQGEIKEKIPIVIKELNIQKETIELLNSLPEDLEVLSCSNCGIDNLPKLPKNLKKLYCSFNNLTKLPKLPKGLIRLYCNNNQIVELPKLPKTIEFIHCGKNKLKSLPALPKNLDVLECNDNELKELPKLPPVLRRLDCSNNQLTFLPSLKNILIVNAENNYITTIPKHSGVRDLFLNKNVIEEIPKSLKNSDVNIALFDNPVAKDLYHVSQADLNLIQYGKYNNDKFPIITFRKGTVLFRKHHDLALIAEDFIGKPFGDDYYLSPDHLVWYSLSPFEKYFGNITSINVLQNDVHLILGLLPSTYTGIDIIIHQPTFFQTDCDKKKYIRKVDQPMYKCFKDDFIEQNPDIMGSFQLYIGKADDRTLFQYNEKFILDYESFYQDNTKKINIPEVVLYPRKIRDKEDRILHKQEFTQSWFEKHIEEFNVKPIHVFTNEGVNWKMSLDKYKNIMDQFLSPEGFSIDGNMYHMTVNKKTRDFVIAEFASPELLKLCLPISDKDKQKFLKK